MNQRGEEFKALIEALLDEDAHSTIQELRTVPLVRDFFALWRRDKEAERRSSKATTATNAPPVPEYNRSPIIVNTPTKSPTINHLNDFLHTPTSSSKSPKPTSRHSFAPSRNSARPHTANPGETSIQNTRPLISHPFNAAYEDQFEANRSRSYLAPYAGASRTGRSSTVPNLEHSPIGSRTEAISDVETRPKEPLLLRTIRDNNGIHRAPGRQVSTPELPRSDRLERRSSRELLSRNVDSRAPVNSATPMPVFMLSQRTVSQPGGVRRAALRETAEEPSDQPQPTRTFPFDHPPDTPVTPGMAGLGVGRTGGRHLESLAVLDPEMYQSLSTPQAQQVPWTLPTPANGESTQALPRARKTPPIIDTGNRSARFFVDDPNTGMVDVAGGPPPRSPVSAPMGMDMSYEAAGQFEQVAAMRQFQGMRLGKPPMGRLPPPVKPPLDMSDHGHNSSFSTASGASIPGFSSPNATSSISSQGSPLSTTNGQRFRSRNSLGSVAEQRRLSLDSLVASEFELPYLSRNISTPQFTQKNKSADAVFAANNLTAPSAAISTRGRGSYSSQETDSTGFGLEDNSGFTPYAPARLPPSKAAVIVPKTTPPPRPPRSVLRNSSQFSAGIIHRLNESLSGNQGHGDLGDSHDFIDSYFTTPQIQHATLDPPTPTYVTQNSREVRESATSAFTNIAQYYQNDKHDSVRPSEIDFSTASLPPTPLNANFDHSPSVASYRTPPHNAVSPSIGNVSIKAVHAQSETIVLFKISRHETTLSDLRSKVIRKFRETEGLDLPGFTLKYLPPRSDHGFISSQSGRKRSNSVSSTSDISVLASLDTEAEWQRALAGNNKIVIRIV